METAKILEILGYTLPSLVTGGVAYFLFDNYFKDQEKIRRWLLQKENKKDILPLRLQAYERLSLLMERINPSQILLRNTPITTDKKEFYQYANDIWVQRGYASYYQIMIKIEQEKAKELIHLLEEELAH